MKTMKHLQRNKSMRQQAGLTLIEIIIWAVVVGIVSTGLYAGFDSWKRGNDVTTTNDIVSKLVNNAPNLRKSYGSFEGLDTTYVWSSNKLLDKPYKSSTTGKIITPYSTDGIDVQPASSVTTIDGTSMTGTNMFWAITINDVLANSCQDIVEYWYPKALEVQVGTTRIASAPNATTECNRVSGTTNIVVIVN